MRIAVAGTGYVGISIAALLAREHDVVAVDVVPERIELINRGRSPLADRDIELFLSKGMPKLTATWDAQRAYRDADFVAVAVPTNYDTQQNSFDISALEAAPAGIGCESRGSYREQIYGSNRLYRYSSEEAILSCFV